MNANVVEVPVQPVLRERDDSIGPVVLNRRDDVGVELRNVEPAEIAVAVIALMTVANLRGLRESGNIFVIPTYSFVALALLMVGIGLFNIATGAAHPIETPNAEHLGTAELSLAVTTDPRLPVQFDTPLV